MENIYNKMVDKTCVNILGSGASEFSVKQSQKMNIKWFYLFIFPLII